MHDIIFDLRDAFRSLRRDPAYAAAVVLTLALTIGATTAVYSIVDGVLLRPLTYPESQRLVVVQEIVPGLAHLYPSLPANPRHFAAWRTRASSFDQLAELDSRPSTLTGAGEPLQLEVVSTTGNLFDVLGSPAAIGRALRVDDERKDGQPVIVLTDRLWRTRFNADPGVVGRAVTLDGARRIVVGVLQPGFQFPEGADLGGIVRYASAPDAFVPLRIDPEQYSPNGEYNYVVLGRLAPGSTVERSLAELNVLQADIAATLTHEPGLRARVVPLVEAVVGASRRGLMLLFAAILAVLLIACANLANLSLTRSLARGRDAAVRVALGASRARLASRLLLEQSVLAVTGGALGLLVAYIALGLFVRTAPVDLPRLDDVGLNLRVLGFTAAVSVAAALLVAIAPVVRLAGRAGAARDLQPLLRAGGLATTSDRGGLRARAVLLAAQVALSVTLLTVTLLLARSFVRVTHVDRGFAVDRVLAVDVTLPGARYAAADKRTHAYDAILGGIRALPGVQNASWISNLPLTGESWVDAILPKERPASSDVPLADYRFVSPAFFETLSIPIRRGRALAAADLDESRATTAAVVSERVASRLWPGVDPIGRRFTRGDSDEKPFEIVGVAPDGRPADLERAPAMMVYVPYSYRSRTRASLVIHAAGDLLVLAGPLRQAIWHVDPEIAIANVRPMDQLLDAALGGRRYQTTLFLAFSGVALLIAALGVYAVTAYGVSRRRREMNIRVALGAKPSQALGLVVRQGFQPVAIGVAVGIVGALGAGTLVSGLLFEVGAHDPLVIASTAAFMGAVGLAACGAAARHGVSINPASALREE